MGRNPLTSPVLPVLLWAAAVAAGRGRTPTQLPPLGVHPHPRLIITDGDVARVQGLVATDPVARRFLQRLEDHAEAVYLHRPPTGEAALRDGMYTLALLFRVSGNVSYAKAGIAMLLSATRSPDYCQGCGGDCTKLEPQGGQNAAARSISLCFGVLGEAVALGYDQFYHTFETPEDLDAVRRFISTQILSVYSQGLSRAFTAMYWWRARDNFNSVINSGALLSALAVLDEGNYTYGDTRRFAMDTLQVALLALPRGARSIGDDGGYPEGPGYGDFAISHHLQAVRGLESALGSSYGLDVRGLKHVAGYYLDIGSSGFSPSGLPFNWADGGTGAGSWLSASLARRYNRDEPGIVFAARNFSLGINATQCGNGKGHAEPGCAMWLLDYDQIGTQADLDELPLVKFYPSVDIGVLRSSWDLDTASYIAFKGGNNALQQIGKGTTHTHADQGSFVLDMLGVRWAVDLGADSYYDYGYFSLQKFDWYNSGTAGHNTLRFNGQGQTACMDGLPAQLPSGTTSQQPVSPTATACRATIEANKTAGWGIINMSESYSESGAVKVYRGVALDGANVIVRDEFGLHGAKNVTISIHTTAFVQIISATHVQLTQPARGSRSHGALSNVTVHLRTRTDCRGMGFSVVEASNFPDTHNGDVKENLRVVIFGGSSSGCTYIDSIFSATPAQPAKSNALNLWPTSGPANR